MCNRYHPTSRAHLNQRQLFDPQYQVQGPEYALSIGPRQNGPFIKPTGEIVVGQWGMIRPGSPERPPMKNGRPLMTNNARSETIATAPTYRDAWKKGQRCLIPADLFLEPYWGTGKNIWWQFARADGAPWMIAGLWSEWTDRETGEVIPNYTMVTMNADDHPLMRLMHRPDHTRPETQQDKRSVVPLERSAWDAWMNGTADEAMASLRLPPLEVYRHGAEDPAKSVALPV